jgi:hypothetical protein
MVSSTLTLPDFVLEFAVFVVAFEASLGEGELLRRLDALVEGVVDFLAAGFRALVLGAFSSLDSSFSDSSSLSAEDSNTFA